MATVIISPPTESPIDLEPTSPEVKRYQRLRVYAACTSAVLALSSLVLMVAQGKSLDEWFQMWLGESVWLRLLAMAIVVGGGMELLTLPVDYLAGFVLEHRFQLSTQTFGKWLRNKVKKYLVGGPIVLLLIFGLYAMLRYSTPWWLWATVGMLVFTLVMGRLVPTLILPFFFKVTPLEAPDLRERLEKLAAGTGLTLDGVYRLHLSEETRKANAALAGMGRSRRVLLGDTLLESFSLEEIEVVFAHEVGHHVHKHLLKMIVLNVLATFASLWLIDMILRNGASAMGYENLSDPAGLPLVLLVMSLFAFTLAPLMNAISRHFERQCDRYALDRTGANQAYRSAFVKLARMNKSDPDPNPLVVLLFYDHPPIRERLAMAAR